MSDAWSEPWTQALFPAVFRVWGQRLHPLTLGHLSAFRAFGHPLVSGGLLDRKTVAEAVWLARVSGVEAMAAMSDSRTEKRLERFGIMVSRKPLAPAVESVRAWWDWYMRRPRKHDDASVGDERVPIEWYLFWRMAGRALPDPKAASRIWNTPVNAAVCLHYVESYMGGDDSLIGSAEADVMARLMGRDG